MMLVTLSFEYCRTRFQTLMTSPQVVSTSWQPFAVSFSRVVTSVPKAGMITTSPAWMCSRSASVGFGGMLTMPRLLIWSLTSGLWMISPSRKIRVGGGKTLRAA